MFRNSLSAVICAVTLRTTLFSRYEGSTCNWAPRSTLAILLWQASLTKAQAFHYESTYSPYDSVILFFFVLFWAIILLYFSIRTYLDSANQRREATAAERDRDIALRMVVLEEREAAAEILKDSLNASGIDLRQKMSEFYKVSRGKLQDRSGRKSIAVNSSSSVDRSGLKIATWLRSKIDKTEKDELPVYPIAWWVEDGKPATANGLVRDLDTKGSFPDLSMHQEALYIGYISVIKSADIAPAVKMIKEALDQIDFYDTPWVRRNPSRAQFARSIAVDCEFTGGDWFHKGQTPDEMIPGDRQKRIVSLLTLSVDRYFVASFHISDMMLNPHENTSNDIAHLFREIILNTGIIKFWYNLDQDIKTMEETLDHLFRTPIDEEYRYLVKVQNINGCFNVERPEGLWFKNPIRKENNSWRCPYAFHLDYDSQQSCPCPCRSNNLDLAVITDFILRDLNFNSQEKNGIHINKREWTRPRPYCSYEKFQLCMFMEDRFKDVFQRFKNYGGKLKIPNRPDPRCTCKWSNQEEEALAVCNRECEGSQPLVAWSILSSNMRSEFYALFEKPEFEQDVALVSYIVGDVIGVALAARFLMTTENQRLLTERLVAYGSLKIRENVVEIEKRSKLTRPMNSTKSWTEQLMAKSKSLKVPIVIDNPELSDEDLLDRSKDLKLIQWFRKDPGRHGSAEKIWKKSDGDEADEGKILLRKGLTQTLLNHILEDPIAYATYESEKHTNSPLYQDFCNSFSKIKCWRELETAALAGVICHFEKKLAREVSKENRNAIRLHKLCRDLKEGTQKDLVDSVALRNAIDQWTSPGPFKTTTLENFEVFMHTDREVHPLSEPVTIDTSKKGWRDQGARHLVKLLEIFEELEKYSYTRACSFQTALQSLVNDKTAQWNEPVYENPAENETTETETETEAETKSDVGTDIGSDAKNDHYTNSDAGSDDHGQAGDWEEDDGGSDRVLIKEGFWSGPLGGFVSRFGKDEKPEGDYYRSEKYTALIVGEKWREFSERTLTNSEFFTSIVEYWLLSILIEGPSEVSQRMHELNFNPLLFYMPMLEGAIEAPEAEVWLNRDQKETFYKKREATSRKLFDVEILSIWRAFFGGF